MKFKLVIESWNYKCPRCSADLSVIDEKCNNCGLDFASFVISETEKKFSSFIQNLPFPIVLWHIYETLLILIIYLVANLLTNFFQMKLQPIANEKYLFYTVIFTFLNSLILLFGSYFIVKKKYKQNFSILGLKYSKKNIGNSIFEALKYSFIFVLFNLISIKYILDTGVVFSANQTIFSLLMNEKTLGNLIFTLIIFGVIIPFIEEIFFRGFMFKAFRVKFNFLQAAVLTSLIFGVLHIEPNMIPISIASSFLFCLLFEKYENIFPSFFMHSLINISFIFFVFNDGYFIGDISWSIIILGTIIISTAIFLLNNIKLFLAPKRIFLILSSAFNILMIFIILFSFSFYSLINSEQLLKNNYLLSLKTLLLINQSRFSDAESLINKAIDLQKKEDAELLGILQMIYYYDGEHKKSVETGKRILDAMTASDKNLSNKKYIETINSMALSLAELELDFTEYFDELKRYLKNIDNPSADIKETIGWLYVKSGELKLGEKLMLESYQEQQTFSKLSFAETNYHLGYLYYKLGNNNRAIYYLKNVEKYNKSNYFVKQSSRILEKILMKEAI
ncbi:MAG TPA: type II CAAX endopeptidase family protein [bacterium]|nr:type II CAAX endopeptidase family protein [bacterium]